MIRKICKKMIAFSMAATIAFTTTGCGELFFGYNQIDTKQALDENYQFPLKEKETITGLISYPTASEPDPNKRAIFERLEKATNVHVDWTAIPADQWSDKIALQMVNYKTLQDFVFSGGFSDSNLLKYADQGVIIPLEDYIDKDMPNLKKVFEKYPEYKTMVTATDGHIYSLPWIEQLGEGKTAIQTVGGMSYINKKWLDFLGLEVPTDIASFENVLQQFKDHADELQSHFHIEGSIIPMSCIVNNGDQDPAILINGFGEGYGDADKERHIAVTDNKQVISAATQEGYKKGIQWLHELYAKGLIDPECFTQEWSTYVSKGKSGRYGVCFSWDIANIDNLKDWVPLPALTADTRNITPQNGSFTSGFDRGRCVITALAKHPALVCSWLDQMYAPLQSPQNNWGTYGEQGKFNIFEMSKNSKGEPMLKHAPLGDVSPVEVREAQSVGGPLAILNEYYNVYVTVPDDAQYRLDWIKDIYTPDMHTKYVYPNVFMSQKDTEEISNLLVDIKTEINTKKSDWIMNGMSDADWNEYLKKLDAYGLQRFLEIHQSYLDRYFEALGQ